MHEPYPNPQATSVPVEQSKSKELMNEAVVQAKQAGSTLAVKAKETATEAKHEARRQIDEQKKEVVRQVGDVNHALRSTAENLENPSLGRQLVKLADQVEHAANRLEEAELEDLVEAAEDFSRSQPAMFLTGTFFLGLMTARFLRAHRPESGYETPMRVESPAATTHRTMVEREVGTDEHLIGR